jgi:dihydroxyacetone kinase-like protein
MLAAADKIIESEPILTDADRALGDGDHGVGMERGMTAVKEALAGKDFPSAGKVFVAVGTAMMSSMGGASGAIFGILFRSGGKAVGDVTEFTAAGLASLLREGTDQVMTKGAKPGDKTMVDALFPAAAKAAEVSGDPVDEALSAAGRDASKDMVATMGRAKTLGENSLGKPDAGAVSVAIILAAMSDFVAGL